MPNLYAKTRATPLSLGSLALVSLCTCSRPSPPVAAAASSSSSSSSEATCAGEANRRVARIPMTRSSVSTDAAFWPDLSGIPHVAGRPATADDIRSSRAVFLLGAPDADRSLGVPLDIAIPQYAYHQQGSGRTPCIVIQGESDGDKRVVGCLVLPDRTLLAGLLGEFELLGSTKPFRRL